MHSINIRNSKKCAICKYWYDPRYEAITPRAPQINQWEVDDRVNKMCLQKGISTAAMSTCGKFACKLEII